MTWLFRTITQKPWLVSLGVITSFVLALFLANYTPGTFLTGWDNLHPEFDFWLNIKRSLFVTWQEYQGLGVLGGMGHAADLPRQLFLWLLSLVLPSSTLRYTWAFLMLWLGPTGLLVLLRKFILRKSSPPIREVASLLGALFYLLNLGTVQNFYVPFETFISQYGFLPWILVGVVNYLSKPSRHAIALLFFILVCATPLGYVPTVFVSTVGVVFLFIVNHLLAAKTSVKSRLLHVSVVISLFIAANLYWLTSPLFFTITQQQTVFDSKINSFVSDDARYSNQKAGTWENVAQLKGYWFDYIETQPNLEVKYLLENWRTYTSQTPITAIGVSFFILSIIGLVFMVGQKNNPYTFALVSWWCVAVFMLLNNNPPFGFIFTFLQTTVPLFGEVFRYVFTKWSVVAVGAYSAAIGLGVAALLRIVQFLIGKHHFKLQAVAIGSMLGLSLVIFCWPMFTGNLINPAVKLTIPEEYFETMAFFKNKPSQVRVMNLPQYTFYGWNIYQWGYSGSGWWWHGVDQPFLDRAFDVWRPENEYYYTQLDRAIYSSDRDQFRNILKTYGVGFIVLDYNLENNRATNLPQLETLINQEGSFKQVAQFGKIKIFEHQNLASVDGYVKAPANYATTTQFFGGEQLNPTLSTSVVMETTDPSLIYPFTQFKNYLSNNDFTELSATFTVPSSSRGLTLRAPNFLETEEKVPVAIYSQPSAEGYELTLEYLIPDIKINNTSVADQVIDTISLTAPSSSENRVLSINETDYFTISVASEKKKIGSTYLSTKKTNQIKLYTFEGAATDLEEQLATKPVQACSQQLGSIKKSVSSDNGITLSGSQAIGCIPLEVDLNTDNNQAKLVRLAYDYASQTMAQPSVLVKEKDSSTSFNTIPHRLPVSPSWASHIQFATIDSSSSAEYNVEFGLVPLNNNDVFDISYKNPALEVYTLSEEVEYIVAASLSGKVEVPVPADSKLTLVASLPDTQSDISEPLPELTGYYQPTNCDPFNTSNYTKKVSADGVLYQASNASSCDYWYYPQFSTEGTSILSISSDHVSGKALTLCLEETETRKCLIETKLSKDQTKSSQLFLAHPAEGKKGVVLRTDVHGVGPVESSTLLKSFAIKPFAQNWINQVVVTSNPFVTDNLVKVTTTHDEPNSYVVSVSAEEPGVITLNQTFDTNWLAFKSGAPFQFLPHFRVNSWANGWSVPAGDYQVILFFWPQLLSWFGYLVLVITGLVIIGSLVKHQFKKTTPH